MENPINNQEREIAARDEGAEDYEAWYIKKGILHDWVESKVIIDMLRLKREDIVLDVGCGTGRIARKIALQCKKVIGVDFSSKSIQILMEKAKQIGINNIETFVTDIKQPLPIKEQVDKVISIQVIQHIPTYTERCKAVRNLHNQLKDGGVCVITLYNYGFFSKRKLQKEGKFPGGIYYLRFTSDEAEGLMRDCGFKDISIRGCVNFKKYVLVEACGIKSLFRPIARLDAFWSKLKISCLTGEYLVCKGIK